MAKERFLAILMIMMLLMINVFGNIAFADINDSKSINFTDINNHWAKDEIIEYAEKKFLNGYEDNTFKPNNYIKRAEFVKIINTVFGFYEKNNIEFSDVKSTDWFYDEVARASYVGYIKGYSGKKFKPNNYITRQEATTIIARLHDLDKEEIKDELKFNDKNNISNWALNNIKAVVNKGYVTGYKDGSFKPLNNITRAEAVVLISRVAGDVYNISGDYGIGEDVQSINGNVTVSNTGVNLSNLHIKGDLYLTEGIGDGEVCLDNVIVEGKTIVKGGGPNSIIIMNSDLNIIIVNTKTGEVRVVAKGNTNVNNVLLTSGAKLEEEGLQGEGFDECAINVPEGEEVILIGDFEKVEINTPNINVNVQSGSIKNLEISEQAHGTEIEVQKKSSIGKATIKATTNIRGKGEILHAEIHSQMVDIEQKVKKVDLADDVPQAVIDGEIYAGEPTSSSHRSSGSSTTAPTVGGIENNQYYNVNVTPTYNKGTATLAKDGGEAKEFISGTEISEEGSYVLIAIYSGKSTTVSFSIDKTAPEAPVIETTTQTVNADSIDIEGSAEIGATITITGGAITTTGTVNEQGNFTVTVILTQDAVNTLSVTATDEANNESDASSVTITEDSTAPNAPIISIVPETLTNGVVTVTITAEQDATIHYMKTEDSEYLAYSDPFQVSQNTTISAYAVDLYENQSESAEMYIGNIDIISPVITINGDETVTIEALEVYVDLGATAIDDVSGEIEVTSTSSVNTSVVGTYMVTYTAIDTAGNTVTAARTVEVVDTTAPVITITGENPVTVEKDTDYTDTGVTAIDSLDGPIDVTSTSSVDTSTIGSYTVTYSAIDLSNNEVVATRVVIVEDTIAPEAPVIETSTQTVNAERIIIEGTAEVGTIINITGGKNIATGTVNEQGNFTVSVELTQDAINTLSVTATDEANNESNASTVTITENTSPIAVDDTATTYEDTEVTIDVLTNDSDVDGDTLNITSVTDASNGATEIVNNQIKYTPNENFNGNDSFEYTISDGNGETDTATVTITVNPVNDSPIAVDDTATTYEDTEVTIDVLTNDSDVDGDTLNITSVTDASNGATEIVDNQIKYTPNENFNGNDSFEYTISDGNGETDTATVTITVNSVNDAPVAIDDTITTSEDTEIVISVMTNDIDVDGDSLNIISVTNASNGITEIVDNQIKYTPNVNFNGEDSFTYTISDENGEIDTATVTITVNPVNDAPVANADVVEVDEDSTKLVAVLINDIDVDGDLLGILSYAYGYNTTVSQEGDSLRYTPNANFNGTDIFYYSIFDRNGGTDTATVTVTVNAINDAPVAEDDTAITDEDNEVTINVMINDIDVDGDTLNIISVTNASNGTTEIVDNQIKYTPIENFNGNDSFIYTISDGNGETDTATVTITVNAINDAPTVVESQETQTGNATPASNDCITEVVPYTANIIDWFEDIDVLDILTYEVVSAIDNATILNDVSNDVSILGDNITYIPQAAQAEKIVTIIVKANDGELDSTSNVTITVTVGALPTDAPPTLSNVETSETVPNTIEATSDKDGTLYLVDSYEAFEYNDYADVDNLEFALYDNCGRKVSCTANIEASIPTDGLPSSHYVVYAVDSINNISDPSVEITITNPDETPPILTEVKAKTGDYTKLLVTSNEDSILFIVDKSKSNTYGNYETEDDLYDATGNGDGIEEGPITANQPYEIDVNGLVDGTTYIILAQDLAENISDPSADVIINNGEVDLLPTASPTLIGTEKVGETLTASTGYNDVDGDIELGTTFAFFRYDSDGVSNETEVQSASTTNTYTLLPNDEGKVIKVKVVPINARGTGLEVESNTTGVITAEPSSVSATLEVLGDETTLCEGMLHESQVKITLANETFNGTFHSENYTLCNEPAGLSIDSVEPGTNNTEVIITFSYDDLAPNFDIDITNFNIMIASSELSGNNDIVTNNITIEAVNEVFVTNASPIFPDGVFIITLDRNITLEDAQDLYVCLEEISKPPLPPVIIHTEYHAVPIFVDGNNLTYKILDEDLRLMKFGLYILKNYEIDWAIIPPVLLEYLSPIPVTTLTPIPDNFVVSTPVAAITGVAEPNAQVLLYILDEEDENIYTAYIIGTSVADLNGNYSITNFEDEGETVTLMSGDLLLVRSINIEKELSDFEIIQVIGTQTPPTNLTLCDDGVLEWNTVDSASGYKIWLYKDDVLLSGYPIAENDGSSGSIDLSQDIEGVVGTYKAKIQTLGDGVNTFDSAESDFSNTISVVQLFTPTELTWDGYTATFNNVNEGKLSGIGAPYTYQIYFYNNYHHLKTVDGFISEGSVTYDFYSDILATDSGNYTYKVKAISPWNTIIDSALSEHSNEIILTATEIDEARVNVAKATLAEVNILNPVEGTDTNVVAMAQALVDAEVDGVTVTLKNRTDTQIALDGEITYGSELKDISVTFYLAKGDVKVEQVMIIYVPATQVINQAPTATNVDINYTYEEYFVGANLTGYYNYNDSEGDIEGSSLYKWYRGNSEDGTDKAVISGETNKIYTMTSDDIGKYIFFEVTPVAKTGITTGETTISTGIGPVVQPISASINPTEINFSLSSPNDVLTTVTLNDALAIDNVKNGSTYLIYDSDFIFNNGEITIKKSYIEGLNHVSGENIALTINFEVGNSRSFIIHVVN